MDLHNSQIKSENWITIILIVSVVFNFTFSMIGINHPITEMHGFRQTQTAISTYYLIKDGFTIDYITPVLGYPWKIPFEFPIFQFIVAFLNKIFNCPLDLTGRLVSLFFFYSTIIYTLLFNSFLNSNSKKLISILLLTHPIYLFWSRTFMIESTALFFTVLFLTEGFKFFNSNNKISFLLFITFGILASLTKVTTFLVAVICLSIFVLLNLFEKESRTNNLKKVIYIGSSIIFILIIFFIWNSHCDKNKELNFLSSGITSRALRAWNFGTIQARFDVQQWRSLIENSSYTYVLGLFLLILGCIEKVKSKYFWSFVLAGLIAPLIFFNLYKVHNYYHFANNLYILVAFAMIFNQFKTKPNWILPVIVISILVYKDQYYYFQRVKSEYTVLVGNECKKVIQPDENMIVIGNDWSSEIPYYSERKSVCITGSRINSIILNPNNFCDSLNTKNIKLLALVQDSYKDSLSTHVSAIVKYYGFHKRKNLPKIKTYFYY